MIRLKVFGERNTGTNYFIELLRLNTPWRVPSGGAPAWWLKVGRRLGLGEGTADWHFALTSAWNLGWKHRSIREFLEKPPEGWSFVCLVKNPYSWLLSLQKRPYHNWELADLELDVFLDSELEQPWRARERDRGRVDPVTLWNRRHGEYRAFEKAHDVVRIVRYEDLVADPESVVRELVEEVAPGSMGTRFVNLEDSTKEPSKSYKYYREYYGKRLWRKKLEPRHLTTINPRLDAEVARSLGYEILEPGR